MNSPVKIGGIKKNLPDDKIFWEVDKSADRKAKSEKEKH